MKMGLIGTKIGMTHRFHDDGTITPVTVVQVGPCPVVQVKTMEKDGYNALQLGFGDPFRKTLTRTRVGHFKKVNLEPMAYLKEFRIDETSQYKPGDSLTVDLFSVGEIIDISGISKGKGFAGVVKRYHFKGGSRSHGTHRRHRAPGSIGSSAWPSRVFKGKRMGGHMGAKQVTSQNLKIIEINKEKNLLLVKGAIPGPTGAIVIVRKGVKASKA